MPPRRHPPTPATQAAVPLIAVENLRVERERVILDNINWTMNAGENWVILGANGSGKTSLLAVLTGYLPETSGSVRIAGAVRGEDDWRELRKRVGLVSTVLARQISPNEPALCVVFGGHDAMLNFGIIKEIHRKHAALTQMRRTGCAHLCAQPWGTLSQGERQHVLIARALYSGLSVLILDEPCAGLDPLARERFLQMLTRLSTGKNAVPLVLVTHHVEEIIPAFSHALLLRKGRVLASGTVRDTLTASNLSALFSTPVSLRRSKSRYFLDVTL
ncbi:MAG: ATP-binding cassette domain-containing protein [Puniceicoccales bacterium]|jgi:iron complex transport system ATP-binding protein|nr:ATP-binding cassette domain-containing protein [Puniceicoccales bacterium]